LKQENKIKSEAIEQKRGRLKTRGKKKDLKKKKNLSKTRPW
jgi:hypothetical protein